MPRRPARPGALKDLAPLRIVTQIALLQLAYYVVAVVLIAFVMVVATGQRPEAKHFLDWRELRGDVTTGWTLGLCWMLDSLVTVIPILLLIARSKLVTDFALTIHFLHLVITSLYVRAIPTTIYWWLIQTASAGLMTGVGIWACRWRELQPMAFGGKSSKGKQPANGHAVDVNTMEEGEGSGSRGRDGAGTYEMVSMAPREPA
ncbi:hypothetical protein LTS10_002402 [Elasticomyces elasticus]|nr:hypothetical protein LTS10_002402 [Elasticomyces elasticus]